MRTGLPRQMVEIHDPLRILFVIEQHPEIVTRVIESNPALKEWVGNEWVKLAVCNPDNGEISFWFDNSLQNLDTTFPEIFEPGSITRSEKVTRKGAYHD